MSVSHVNYMYDVCVTCQLHVWCFCHKSATCLMLMSQVSNMYDKDKDKAVFYIGFKNNKH